MLQSKRWQSRVLHSEKRTSWRGGRERGGEGEENVIQCWKDCALTNDDGGVDHVAPALHGEHQHDGLAAALLQGGAALSALVGRRRGDRVLAAHTDAEDELHGREL